MQTISPAGAYNCSVLVTQSGRVSPPLGAQGSRENVACTSTPSPRSPPEGREGIIREWQKLSSSLTASPMGAGCGGGDKQSKKKIKIKSRHKHSGHSGVSAGWTN